MVSLTPLVPPVIPEKQTKDGLKHMSLKGIPILVRTQIPLLSPETNSEESVVLLLCFTKEFMI